MSESPPCGRATAATQDHLAEDPANDDAPVRVVNSEDLLAGRTQLAIRHNRSVYFLRQTKFGKLILTK